MKCPIKRLESECIQKECPLYFTNSCGLSSLVFDLSCAVDSVSDSVSNIEDKLEEIGEVLYDGLKRR